MEKNNLDIIVKKVILSTEEQLKGDFKESIDYELKNTENLYNSAMFFKCFKEMIEKKLEEIFEKQNYPKDYEEFKKIYAKVSEEANYHFNKPHYKCYDDKYQYEFIYLSVYCNAYIKYTFGLLFNGNNYSILEELKEFDAKDIIITFRKYLHLITLNKLKITYGLKRA
ncbi:hypothetical protein [Clostridium tarantellae]|uniref:Uncharacterized protein n=1 Tax=Clostridium tarantellae TaxID=39493 RepID=A0A6I1MMN6_9CLOT|nr:hypothetical protein [Clostridium tarantellae]MPQ44655.1 hypothetical protein [Clostridium tarantellae]